MAAKKLAVSLDESLADEVVRAAEQDTDGNVSAWIAQAARERLRQAAARQLLKELIDHHGSITDQERDEVRRQWPRG